MDVLGESHTLYVDDKGVLTVASDPVPAKSKIAEVSGEVNAAPTDIKTKASIDASAAEGAVPAAADLATKAAGGDETANAALPAKQAAVATPLKRTWQWARVSKDPAITGGSLEDPLKHPYYKTFKERVAALSAMGHIQVDAAPFAESTWKKICAAVKAATPQMNDPKAYSDFAKGWLDMKSAEFQKAISEFDHLGKEIAKAATSQFSKAKKFGFWSKDEGRSLSEAMNDLTLETSAIGSLMDGLPTLDGKKAGWDPEIWGALSKAYAETMVPHLVNDESKKVNVCVGAGVPAGNIWETVESVALGKGLEKAGKTLEGVTTYWGAAAKSRGNRKQLDETKNVGAKGSVYKGDRAGALAAADKHFNALPAEQLELPLGKPDPQTNLPGMGMTKPGDAGAAQPKPGAPTPPAPAQANPQQMGLPGMGGPTPPPAPTGAAPTGAAPTAPAAPAPSGAPPAAPTAAAPTAAAPKPPAAPTAAAPTPGAPTPGAPTAAAPTPGAAPTAAAPKPGAPAAQVPGAPAPAVPPVASPDAKPVEPEPAPPPPLPPVVAEDNMEDHHHTLTIDPNTGEIQLASVMDNALKKVNTAIGKVQAMKPDAESAKAVKRLQAIKIMMDGLKGVVDNRIAAEKKAIKAKEPPPISVETVKLMDAKAKEIMAALKSYGKDFKVRDIDIDLPTFDLTAEREKLANEVSVDRVEKLLVPWQQDLSLSEFRDGDGPKAKEIWANFVLKSGPLEAAAKPILAARVAKKGQELDLKADVEKELTAPTPTRKAFHEAAGAEAVAQALAHPAAKSASPEAKKEINATLGKGGYIYRETDFGKIQGPAGKQQADEKLQTAVSSAGGIVPFLQKMARSQKIGDYEYANFVADWDAKQANKDFIKDKFRAADDGKHEWITSDLIGKVVQLAHSAKKTADCHHWVDLQHELRVDTSHLILDPDHELGQATKTIKGKSVKVLCGHVGALYVKIGGSIVPMTSNQNRWHNKLRDAFNAEDTFGGCIGALKKIFVATVWDGSKLPSNLHKDYVDASGNPIDFKGLAGAQADNYDKCLTVFKKCLTKFSQYD